MSDSGHILPVSVAGDEVEKPFYLGWIPAYAGMTVEMAGIQTETNKQGVP